MRRRRAGADPSCQRVDSLITHFDISMFSLHFLNIHQCSCVVPGIDEDTFTSYTMFTGCRQQTGSPDPAGVNYLGETRSLNTNSPLWEQVLILCTQCKT